MESTYKLKENIMNQSHVVRLDVKALSDEGTFEGFAAVYGNRDEAGETIVAGALTTSIRQSGPTFPLLWSHDSATPIGTVTVEDSPRGLLVKGKLILTIPKAAEVLTLLREKVIRGLSIGYKVVTDKLENGGRLLTSLRLFEVSLVTLPANPLALVYDVKQQTASDVAAVRAVARDIADFRRSLA
jgi:HK97 family phage prohead protease